MLHQLLFFKVSYQSSRTKIKSCGQMLVQILYIHSFPCYVTYTQLWCSLNNSRLRVTLVTHCSFHRLTKVSTLYLSMNIVLINLFMELIMVEKYLYVTTGWYYSTILYYSNLITHNLPVSHIFDRYKNHERWTAEYHYFQR